MNRRLVVVLTLLAFAVPAARTMADGFADARAGTTRFHVSKSPKNSINLTSKAPGETFKGASKTITGDLSIDPAKLDSAKGEFHVPFKSLDTGIPQRNQHMMSSMWIDSAKYPDAVFTVTGIEKAKASKSSVKATLTGKMAIHGKENDISIPVTMVYIKGSGKDTLSIRAKFPIALADYGIVGKGVGSKVANEMKMSVAVTLSSGESSAKAK